MEFCVITYFCIHKINYLQLNKATEIYKKDVVKVKIKNPVCYLFDNINLRRKKINSYTHSVFLL